MIKFNGKEPRSILYMNRPVLAVYINKKLIWPQKKISDIILSCYYNGYWIDEYPWTDDNAWTD